MKILTVIFFQVIIISACLAQADRTITGIENNLPNGWSIKIKADSLIIESENKFQVFYLSKGMREKPKYNELYAFHPRLTFNIMHLQDTVLWRKAITALDLMQKILSSYPHCGVDYCDMEFRQKNSLQRQVRYERKRTKKLEANRKGCVQYDKTEVAYRQIKFKTPAFFTENFALGNMTNNWSDCSQSLYDTVILPEERQQEIQLVKEILKQKLKNVP